MRAVRLRSALPGRILSLLRKHVMKNSIQKPKGSNDLMRHGRNPAAIGEVTNITSTQPNQNPTQNTPLREMRRKAGLSQAKLARKLGVTQIMISKWESDKQRPTDRRRMQLKQVFQAELDDKSPNLLHKRVSDLKRTIHRTLSRSNGPSLEARKSSKVKDKFGEFAEFDPHSLENRPQQPGVYVLYDSDGYPFRIGQTGNIRKRIPQHKRQWWHRKAVLNRASWIRVCSEAQRLLVEEILIKFINWGLENRHHVRRRQAIAHRCQLVLLAKRKPTR